MVANTRLHFSRFEFKYVLPKALRQEVESELAHFVDLDPFVAQQPNHKYFVRSLYWDDRHYTSYFEKTDGMLLRSKFRIRTYEREPGGTAPRFLEVKGRYNNLVFKHRIPLDLTVDDPFAAGQALAEQTLRQAPESPVRREFEFQLARRQLQPVALVDYLRRPYVSKYDPEFRLTFDEDLRGTQTDTMFPSGACTSRRMITGYTVMEVKFRHHLPAWFHRIIQSYQLRRVSISKICDALETLGLTTILY